MADIPAEVTTSVVTLGTFDGVHAGHRAVLSRVLELARSASAPAVAITFDPHPRQVLVPDQAPPLLTSPERRLRLLADTGLDAVLLLEFTPELATWSAERFVTEIIVRGLRARYVVVGPDTRFGHRNSGDVEVLRALGERYGFQVEVVPELVDSQAGRWSSTWIREQLLDGQVLAAARALGRPHRVSGTVVHGDHRGLELGYPTANLGSDGAGLIPADGIYAGWLLRSQLAQDARDRVLPAAISIGTNPTFDGQDRRVEAYVIDRTDLDLYGEMVDLELVQRLRPTVRFATTAEPIEQMAKDVAECRHILAAIVPTE
ncbi:MAG: bifunctional riboflavin kinase/FAD synthetase [Angustibacter sp.]